MKNFGLVPDEPFYLRGQGIILCKIEFIIRIVKDGISLSPKRIDKVLPEHALKSLHLSVRVAHF